MATTTLISVEEYLRTSFEGTDAEYVHGEVVERSMPDLYHSRGQQNLAEIFGPLRRKHNFDAGPELRLRLAPDVVRIPDYCVFREKQSERVPPSPPMVAVEILSPGDRPGDLGAKLAEYEEWGIEHIWVAEPGSRRMGVFAQSAIRYVDKLELPEFGLTITEADLFD